MSGPQPPAGGNPYPNSGEHPNPGVQPNSGGQPNPGVQPDSGVQGGVDPNLFYYPPDGGANQGAPGDATWAQPPGPAGNPPPSTGAIPAYGAYQGSGQIPASPPPGQQYPNTQQYTGQVYGPPGAAETQAGYGSTGYGNTGYGQAGHGQPGFGQPGGPGQPGYGQPPSGSGMYGFAPQKKNNTKLIAIIGGAVVAIIALVAGLAIVLGGGDDSNTTTADGGSDGGANAALPTFPDTLPRKYDAACRTPTSTSTEGATETELRAGPLHFDRDIIPDYTERAARMPGIKSGIGADTPVVGQTGWVTDVEIGLTKSAATDDDPGQMAVDLLACQAVSGVFGDDEPDVRNFEASNIKIDGVDAVRVEADLWLDRTITGLTMDGDHSIVIVIGSAPQTYFSSTYPIGDTGDYRDATEAVIDGLQVDQDM